MDKQFVVEFNNVSKIYDLKKGKNKENGKRRKFYALKNVNFKVEKGDSIGILGTNGSGKSTVSSILAGISTADQGEVKIVGEQSLIVINTGIKNQLSGIENIRFKAALLGLSKKATDKIIDGVIEFAELGDFLYQPVKTYSTGMKSRLGFSISICLDPDIIIVDEALSVGDKSFAAKCMNKIEELRQSGKTIFFVSHSLGQVKKFCNKGLWIEGGTLVEYGEILEVADKYEAYSDKLKIMNASEKKKFKKEAFNKRVFEVEEKRSLVSIVRKIRNNFREKKDL